MLLNATSMKGPTLKKLFKVNTGSQYMHELRWGDGGVNIYEASNTSTTEIIQNIKLGKHLNNELLTSLKHSLTFDK